MTIKGSFLQSREWEQFQHSLGRRTWRLEGILVIRHDLPGGFNYLYCPRPRLSHKPQATSHNFFTSVGDAAKQEKSIFLKIDPADGSIVPDIGCRIAGPLQPRETTIVDLMRSESELLGAMREKTRYNTRLAERKGVTVRKCEDGVSEKDFDTLWRLLEETGERDGFRIHERCHYKQLLRIRSPEFSNEVFFAEHNGVALAAAIINFYRPSGTVTYLHGASGRERREFMAPHLLHWRVIQEAKERGFASYDFWGIDQGKWPGLTRFKLGFGGSTIVHPTSVDIVYRSVWYAAHKASKYIRRT